MTLSLTELEPSYVVQFRVDEPGADIRWADRLGAKYDQDGVLLFRHDTKGPDTVQRFALPDDMRADAVSQTALRLGVQFGTTDLKLREFRLSAPGEDHRNEVLGLADELGVAQLLPPERGHFHLRERGADYLVTKQEDFKPYIVTMEIGANRQMRARLAAAR